MKKSLKMIGIIVFVAIVIYSLAGCKSTPKPTQAGMKLDDRRRPPDSFNSEGKLVSYWLGSRAKEQLPMDQVSILRIYPEVKSLSIDGVSVPQRESDANYGYHIFLAPGNHKISFYYSESRRMQSYKNGVNIDEIVAINSGWIQQEENFTAGTTYAIVASVNDVTYKSPDATFKRHIMGIGGRYSVEIYLTTVSPGNFYSAPKIKPDEIKEIYLEPYDAAIPFESQCFIETRGSIYIVSFNGKTVNWGGGESVTIGIPFGRNELLLSIPDDGMLYKAGVTDWIPGHRYVFKRAAVFGRAGGYKYKSGRGTIQLTDVTSNSNIAVVPVGKK